MTREARITPDVRAVLVKLDEFLKSQDEEGRIVCSSRCGVYAFYDYDGEPIYVGQTYEALRTRIRRHLTNQRTDAVAMHVLDPIEVARVEVWPFWDAQDASKAEKRRVLDRAEFTVFQKLSKEAKISRLLNEKIPAPAEEIELPPSCSGIIIPDDVMDRLGHADERIARRASTIANLAQVVRERDVSIGLRQTLLTQAERLQHLAKRRYDEVAGSTPERQLEEETRRRGPEE
jgi:hypothetical protein